MFAVWLPMFPRPQERWSLPGAVEEFEAFVQFWDDERIVSAEVKQRIWPDYDGEIPWDLFILFDTQATWATANDHVIGLGRTVIGESDKLDALLLAHGLQSESQ